MASSLLRLTTSVVRFRPPLSITVSAHRLPRHHLDNNNTRSFSSPPLPKVKFDLHYLKHQMDIMAGVPSMLITIVNDEEATVNIPGMSKTETDNGPCVSINMPGLRIPKGEECQAVDSAELVVDNKMLIYLKTHTTKYIHLAGIRLPDNIDPNGAFNRAHLGQIQCEIIAHPEVKSKSFTAYKKDTRESIYLKGNMPGVETNVITKEGLSVSLNMPGFEIQDVELGFEYDTLIIEGKRGNEHYIAGIRVPEGFHREEHMIKREMQDGVYKATLPYVDANRRAFSAYR
ncbi:hypothetical protein M8C21_023485 [Ambrosia artemisiifolia]|uniref:Uncharacterized protein n=1 Tax=Ambrosia artemisiifolia TaxID=4212 RepID=A0AAD5BM59_AMBAR|nr:hypothetical protein M8C21_023485 [Ambrosia artemisiifolia]